MKQISIILALWITSTFLGFAQFELPKLDYSLSALEPYIDSATMNVHLNSHHASYTNKLNAAIAKYPGFKNKTIIELFKTMDRQPTELKNAIRTNGGGYYNHCLFWKSMAPAGTAPMSPALEKKIIESFGSVEVLKSELEKAALGRFGSGWAWIIQNAAGKLQIVTTSNQDNTLMQIISLKAKPVLALDVWEHAYYLKYQSKRADYINAFWNVINWTEVEKRINTK